MRPLFLDYLQPARRFGPGGLLLLAAGIAAVVVTLVDYRGINRELSGLQIQADMLDVRPNRKALDRMRKTDDSGRSGDEPKQIEQALRQLETPWGPIFEAVEYGLRADWTFVIDPRSAARTTRDGTRHLGTPECDRTRTASGREL